MTMSELQSVQTPPTVSTNQPPQRIVVVQAKSTGLAIVLAVLFGPIGLLYSTVMGAAVMFIVNIIVAVVTVGFGLLLTWPICGIWAFVAVNAHNKKLLEGQA
jgi:hypothetical protein